MAIGMGNEGLHTWNWSRLGHRKFHSINVAGRRCEVLGWNDKFVAGADAGKGSFAISGIADKKRLGTPPVVGAQVTSIVVCNNAVIVGGGIHDQADADKGYIRAVSLEDGKELWIQKFNVELAFNGLAVAGGEIVATFDDGSVAKLK